MSSALNHHSKHLQKLHTCVACVAWVLVVTVDSRGAISDSWRSSSVENMERVEYLGWKRIYNVRPPR